MKELTLDQEIQAIGFIADEKKAKKATYAKAYYMKNKDKLRIIELQKKIDSLDDGKKKTSFMLKLEKLKPIDINEDIVL